MTKRAEFSLPPKRARPADVARMLPSTVVASLIEAAMIDPETPAGVSRARTRALDFVIGRAKRNHPKHFNQEHSTT